MSTKRDLVEAHGFNRRRLVTAFISGAPGGREVEPVRHGRTVVGGVVLAGLVLAGAAVSGFLQKPPPDNWDQRNLVIGQPSGSRYFALDGQLYPVINITSARLLLGEPTEAVTVDDELIQQKDPRNAVGIAGAPEIPPAASNLIESGWTVCTNTAQGLKVTLSSSPVSEPATGQALLASEGGEVFLVSGGYRYPVPQDDDARLVLRNLGLEGVAPLPVSATWINLLPLGSPVTVPSIPGVGDQVQTGVEGLDTVGTPVRAGGRTYVLASADTLAVTTDFAESLWSVREEPVELDPGQIASLRVDSSVEAVDKSWPEDAVSAYQQPTAPCVRLDTGADRPPVVTLANGTSRAAYAGTTGVARAVDAGAGAVVRAVSASNVLDVGNTYLVDSSGTAFGVGQRADGSALAALGYQGYSPRPMPAAWLEVFRPGPALSSGAAGQAPQTAAGEQEGGE